MRVGSLFSGIGGLDLGLERAGMTVVWQSEIDPYASRVLAKHWPSVPNLGDITTIDWSTVEPVDLICGGYPCQPFSLAGARAGSDDARHLWPYFADAIRELRPRWALLENVPGHLSMGFGEVLADLAGLGYDADWDCIPAAAVGAPHLRYRVFVVAHTSSPRRREDTGSAPRDESQDEGWTSQHDHIFNGDGQGDRAIDGSDANCQRLEGSESLGIRLGVESRDSDVRGEVANTPRVGLQGGRNCHSDDLAAGGRRHGEPTRGHRRVTEAADANRESSRRIAVPRRERGHWLVEPDVGRVAHGVPSRVDRLKCLGNAVVPQVAEYVGRRIMEAAVA